MQGGPSFDAEERADTAALYLGMLPICVQPTCEPQSLGPAQDAVPTAVTLTWAASFGHIMSDQIRWITSEASNEGRRYVASQHRAH